MIRLTAALLCLVCAAAAAAAQPSAESPSAAANKKAMEGMMHGMEHPSTGDADRDFVTGMLPHHLGAVEMANVELRYGHDPELRRLARSIVTSQTREQAFMRRWLAQHPAQ